MDRVRVAALQYFIRPVRTFDEFEDQVESLAATVADYRCQLMVLPEWFTVQLLTLGNVRRPITEQVRDLAVQAPRINELIVRLAREHGLHIAAGTMPVIDSGSERVHNECLFASPSGRTGCQRKLHMTRFEAEEWFVSPGTRLRVFETQLARIAITICYDVEFPELARAAARAGAEVLLVQSCTDDRQGYLRVRYCA
ncbi:MAG TPA: nitrilase-related carbon-nitrogen hydrolase, partial [Planctomycetota bacterium]|nr:nitrilase-related carbon-nitrogen hydrolase [Planctomycetota bacterium]